MADTMMDEKVRERLLAAGRASFKERVAAGKAARAKTPRETLGHFPGAKRDPVSILAASDAGRVPELVPLRYGRMLASPFAFYRGAAPIMAHDLAGLPRSRVQVQLCGDAHLANFGLFASAERRELFGVNDFDETLPGPFDWDLRRLAASLAIAARDRGFGRGVQREAVRRLCTTWRRRLAEFSEMDALERWYYRYSAEQMVAAAGSRTERRHVQSVIDAAKQRTSRAMLGQATEVAADGRLRIRDEPPLHMHLGRSQKARKAFAAEIQRLLARYRQTLTNNRRALFERFELVDLAQRVVGVGSVGTRCYVALLVAEGDTPLFLQIKEARASVLEPYLGRSRCPSHGQRVVSGQRLVQSETDVFLGWTRAASTRDFYVRQLRDRKGAFDIENFDAEDFYAYAGFCASALALSMSRAGDPAMLRGYVGRSEAFDDAVVRFAMAYAEQNEADWRALKAAVRARRVQAIRGL